MRSQSIRVSALIGADIVALALGRPYLTRLGTNLAQPHAWVARDGADAACAQLAGAAIWLLAAWLALGLLATAASRLPGIGGRVGSCVSGLVLPRAVRALLAGSAGLGVLLAPLAAGAATAAHVEAHRAERGSVSAPTVPTPTWPLDTAAPHGGTHRAPPASPPSAHGSVTVRPGDSLWLIAARRLGPHASPARVAATWPRWYAANRGVIGDDPTVITPGQVLHAPATSGQEDS